jgi:hypothetical protein
MYNKEMLKELAKKLTLVAGFATLLATKLAMAQNPGPGPITLPNPLSVSTFQGVVAQVSKFLIEIAIPLTAIMAIIGGFQMMTAGGEPEKFSNGRKTLMYAAIGFAVVLLASGIVQIIRSIL